MPTVSVVIPTYNRASDLERALRSVIGQTFRDWEALVVDNHSTDATDAVVQNLGDSRIRLLKIHNEGIIAASRNLGVRHAAGEYIAFLDSDDWWHPRKLEKAVRHLESGANLVYHELYLVTRPHQKVFRKRIKARALKEPLFADLLLKGNALTNSAVVIRKQVLAAAGGLSEDRELVAIEDFDTWLRASRVSRNWQRIPGVLGYYWAGGGGVSNPRRTLETIAALEQRYRHDFEQLGDPRDIPWLNYAKGKALYRMGSFREARTYLWRVRWPLAPFGMAAKAASIGCASLWRAQRV